MAQYINYNCVRYISITNYQHRVYKVRLSINKSVYIGIICVLLHFDILCIVKDISANSSKIKIWSLN